MQQNSSLHTGRQNSVICAFLLSGENSQQLLINCYQLQKIVVYKLLSVAEDKESLHISQPLK